MEKLQVAELNFAEGSQPYRLRNGGYGVVTGKDAIGNFVGKVLPSELASSWDRLGNDLDGDRSYDLMELVRPNTPDSMRFKATVERLLASSEPLLPGTPRT